MTADLASFIGRYLCVPNSGTSPANKGQCVGLIELWLYANSQPPIWANAVDILSHADPHHFIVTPNSPANFPPPGSIVCWDKSWGNGFGHTAVVVAANAMHLAVFEQNDPTGAAPLVATHGYQGVQGWLTWKP